MEKAFVLLDGIYSSVVVRDVLERENKRGRKQITDPILLRNYLLGFRDRDTGHTLENIVYFELLRRGYDVSIGKVDNTEVDFIASKSDDKLYVQVDSEEYDIKTDHRTVVCLYMAPATGIEPVTTP